jgi:hypothetical protein
VKPHNAYDTGNDEILEEVKYQMYHATSLEDVVENSNQN